VAFRTALAGLGYAAVSAAIALVAMWAAGWFRDEHGRQGRVRREQLWVLVLPATVGGFAGLRYGALAGLAVLLAVGAVLFGPVLGTAATTGPGRVQAATIAVLVYAAPPALLAVA
jgi:hypothetical protein